MGNQALGYLSWASQGAIMKKLMKKLLIHVTQDDIDNGGFGAEHCPAARAVSRTLGVPARMGYRGGRLKQLPEFEVSKEDQLAVEIFVYAWDAGKPLAPFTFTIEF